jgi:hypothetical protein
VPLPRREHWTRQGCSTKSLTLGPELENNQDPKRTCGGIQVKGSLGFAKGGARLM